MIVTLTPNPSLDRTIAIDDLRRGEVLRATSSRLDPGGKGVNVSRVLAAHGIPTLAVIPAGGSEGAQLADLLAPSGVPVVSVPLSSRTRSNVALVEPDGTTTKVNEPGPELIGTETAAMLERLVSFAPRPTGLFSPAACRAACRTTSTPRSSPGCTTSATESPWTRAVQRYEQRSPPHRT